MAILGMFSPICQVKATEPFCTTPVSTPCGADQVFIHVFSVCFGECQILAEQQKADRKVNKGKRYFTNPFAHSI